MCPYQSERSSKIRVQISAIGKGDQNSPGVKFQLSSVHDQRVLQEVLSEEWLEVMTLLTKTIQLRVSHYRLQIPQHA